jgi:hypothetical protein
MAFRAPEPLSAGSDPIDKTIKRRSRFRGSIWPQTGSLAQLGCGQGPGAAFSHGLGRLLP